MISVTTIRIWSKGEITHLLETNDTMVSRSLVKIYEKQTLDERSAEMTAYRNGVGFNVRDARFGTSLAKVMERGGTLSDKQIISARKMLIKYSGQLTKIANERESANGSGTEGLC